LGAYSPANMMLIDIKGQLPPWILGNARFLRSFQK
jgi:hypothetical protein